MMTTGVWRKAPLALMILVSWGAARHASAQVVQVEIVDPGDGGRISPYVYGLGWDWTQGRGQAAWDLRPTGFRFGGNAAERFNWRQNAWNTGADWYFTNQRSRIPSLVDTFLSENASHGAASSVTVSMLGWVAKDGEAVGFPVGVYGPQADAKGEAGNGLDKKGKALKGDAALTSVAAGPEFVREWVSHLKGKFAYGPRHYIVGNEPMLWHRQHRDVHPEPATYDEVLAKFVRTAAAVRAADPEAVIVGPSLWGWLAMERSAFDERGSWSFWRKDLDRDRHDGRPFLEWFLSSVVAEEKRLGMRLLDVVDVHHYPEDRTLRSGQPAAAPAVREARIRSVRTLWDESYVDDSWIGAPVATIARLAKAAAAARPDLKVAVGEYNFRGETDPAGGVAQVLALGIMGAAGVYSANYWTIPPAGSYAAAAFKLFRNYDGAGSAFGESRLSVRAPESVGRSVFAALDAARGIMTVALVNTSVTAPRAFRVTSVLLATGGKPRLFVCEPAPSGSPATLKPSTPMPAGNAYEITLAPMAFALLEAPLAPPDRRARPK